MSFCASEPLWDAERYALGRCHCRIALGGVSIALIVIVLLAAIIPRRVKERLRIRDFIEIEDLPELDEDYQGPDDERPAKLAASWKSVSCTLLASLAAAALAFDAARHSRATSAVGAASWAVLTLTFVLRPPRAVPRLAMSFWTVQALLNLALIRVEPNATSIALGVLSLASFGIGGSYPLQSTYPSRRTASAGSEVNSEKDSPEDACTLWNWWTVRYVRPLLAKAVAQDDLDDRDFWRLSPYFSHRNCLNAFERIAGKSLLLRLARAHKLDIISSIILRTISMSFAFATPLLLKSILEAMASPSPAAREAAYVLATISLVAKLIECVLDLQISWVERRAYERVRGTVMTMLHKKALRRLITGVRPKKSEDEATDEKEEERSAANTGRIVNMMRGDSYNISIIFWQTIGPAFAAPAQIAIASVMLYSILGWSAFAGLIVIAAAYLVELPLWLLSLRILKRQRAAEDARIAVLSNIMDAVRLIKSCGWEQQWVDRAQKARERELRLRWRNSIINIVTTMTAPRLVPLVSFAAYILIAKQTLTVPIAFATLSLWEMLENSITLLPDAIKELIEVQISVRRVERFLSEPDLPEREIIKAAAGESELGFEAGEFSWAPALGTELPIDGFRLTVPSFRFPLGQITLVTGATASGKSTLLNAMLGELDCLTGKLIRPSRPRQIAYAAQSSFLENATIEANIAFGTELDQQRMDAVIDACALRPDLDALEAGILTEIGEGGVTLSGGQRARVALARAVYSHARYLILDDPLSAVDVHTARYIVDHLFRGPLVHGRTVVMTTHLIALCRPLAALLVRVSAGVVTVHMSESEAPSTSTTPPSESETLVAYDKNEAELNKAEHVEPHRLVEEEQRERGVVRFAVISRYLGVAGYWLWIGIVMLFVAFQLLNFGYSFLLRAWAQAYDDPNDRHNAHEHPTFWIALYLLYTFIVGAFQFVRLVLQRLATFRAARILFTQALSKIMRAPFRYYDTTPIGRTLNRLVGDVGTADNELPSNVRQVVQLLLTLLIALVISIVLEPAFAPLAIGIILLYIYVARSFRVAARALRRLEKKAMSPLFASFGTTLEGLITIRAFDAAERIQNIVFERVDLFQNYDHWYWNCCFWLQLRFEVLGLFTVSGMTFLSLLFGVPQGVAAIAITTTVRAIENSQRLVFTWASMEMSFSSVERLNTVLAIETEPSAEGEGKLPPAHWPARTGSIEIEELSFRYAQDLPDVIRDLSLSIRPGEKLGVVGRTGSGKSSLAMTLLRASPLSGGRILIDGHDIAEVSLHALRSRIVRHFSVEISRTQTQVPQNAILMAGSIRTNLDPLENHTDVECLDALRRVHLDIDLSFEVGGGSSTNLSAGQRQQIALARAILRNTAITVLDEATSNIDLELDLKIQAAIREAFSEGIVISIAHRLATVIDYDRIAVMRDGALIETGRPAELLANESSELRAMAVKSGELDLLTQAANRAAP